MEIKTEAIVIRSVDYKDNDRILTLFSLDRGKISAGIKGVRKNGAKLRFASEPFCFAEYVLNQKSGRNTVISASSYDGFYELRTDINKYYAACSVCEVCNNLLPEGMVDEKYFLKTVTAIKNICYGDERYALISFLLESARFAGFDMQFGACETCGNKLDGKVYFDFETGRFSCSECMQGVFVRENTYKILSGAEVEEESESDALLRAARLMSTYLRIKTDTEFSSLDEYIKMQRQ